MTFCGRSFPIPSWRVREEHYQFTWPDKKKAMLAANAPHYGNLRPVADSVGKDGTPGGFDSENLYIEDNLEIAELLQGDLSGVSQDDLH